MSNSMNIEFGKELEFKGKLDIDLSGKVAIVIGGGQQPGIAGLGNGRATSIMLARHGATVVPVARHLDRSQDTVDLIESEGGTGWAYAMDVSYREQCEKLCKDVYEKFGRIDSLIYSVGTNLVFDHASNTTTQEAVHALFDVDTIGCVWCTLEAAPYMEKNETGGAIVNVSSIASRCNGMGVSLGFAMYAMAKRAMNCWGELSALHYAPRGIRINTLVLGPVRSVMGVQDLTKLMGGMPAEVAEAQGNLAVNLKGGRKSVWETAFANTFLVSDAAKFITGMEFVLDGAASLPKGGDSRYIGMKVAELLAQYERDGHL